MANVLESLRSALADCYTIEREIGRGGMAQVFLATDLKHHRPVAIKVLRPELAAALGAERFLREIETVARLSHPHIVPLYDSGVAQGSLYYVMPRIEGESLRERLNREGQLPLEDALQITRDVGDALSYAHSHNVVHRDIKPENILLESGHAVVADFGIARAVSVAGGDRLTETGMAVGTPAYMSPEQASGDPHLDARSDIYSLACVLYEMLAGEPPFTGPRVQAIMVRRLSEPPRPLRMLRDSVSGELEHTVGKALSKAPADRYPTVPRFVEELMRSRPALGTQHSPRWRLVLPIAAAAVALGVTAAALLMRGRSPPLDPRRLVVIPLTNRTRDTALNELGRVAADWIALGMAHEDAFDVVPVSSVSTFVQTFGGDRDTTRALAEFTGSATAISGAYDRFRDTIWFRLEVTDVRADRRLYALGPVGAPAAAPLGAIDRLRALVRDTIVSHFSFPLPERAAEQEPKLLSCLPPDYPDSLRRARVEGVVLAEFIIDTMGGVERGSIRIIGSDHPAFEHPVLAMLEGCRFHPGRVRGQLARLRVEMPVDFRIKRQ